MPRVHTEAQDRAKLRASEQRKLEHAYALFRELLDKHFPHPEREQQEIYVIKQQLLMRIKNQHIKDERYKEYKAKVPTGGY